MGYVSVQGGQRAIENAEALTRYLRLRGGSPPLSIAQITEQLGYLVDRVMGEGGIYAPALAALAIKQAQGDPAEAAFHLRAYRSTLTRLADTEPIDTTRMRLARRISSAFRDIPGGQVLGATPDYTQRILDFSLLDEDRVDAGEEGHRTEAAAALDSLERSLRDGNEPLDPAAFRKVVDLLREQGLAEEAAGNGTRPGSDATAGIEAQRPDDDATAGGNGHRPADSTAGPGSLIPAALVPQVDITTEKVTYPLHRSGRLQMMARGETGGLLAIAYSSMRGYGSVHPTIAELRVGEVALRIPHPYRSGESVHVGSATVTEVEIVAKTTKSRGDGKPRFGLGYGCCFGRNELKAISMATLDRAMQAAEPKAPAEDQEFVLYHTDGIESSGFCSHFKLPHYVTFQSALDRLRASQRESADLRALRDRERHAKAGAGSRA